MTLRQLALEALVEPDPEAKVRAVHALWQAAGGLRERVAGWPEPDPQAGDPAAGWSADPVDGLALDLRAVLGEPAGLPGRPARPVLVAPKDVPTRSPHTAEGRAALLHAIAHIEFNAINLALDAVWRFPGLPPAYYLDWLRVADEEATHHTLLAGHLATLGHAYGDFPGHDGLWLMTWRTREDFIARMALVPRTLEARGLDATPPIQAKLRRAGDLRAVEILDVILRDEVGHVAIGNRWYRWACRRAGEDPLTLYPQLVARHQAPPLRPPLNREARLRAGFSEAELAYLESPDGL